MKIVLTGAMTQTRDKMYQNFSRCGITVMAGVSGKIDYLVTGDAPGASKRLQAKAKGVTILTEDEFNEKLLEEYPEYLL